MSADRWPDEDPHPTPTGSAEAPRPAASGSRRPTVAGSTTCPSHHPASRRRRRRSGAAGSRAWWAGNWTPDDLPALRLVIRLWDRVNRGDVKRAAELRQWMDGYGLTPKGQMDRRWRRPDSAPADDRASSASGPGGRRWSGAMTGHGPPTRSRFKTIPPEQRR